MTEPSKNHEHHDDAERARRDVTASAELDGWIAAGSNTHRFPGDPDPDSSGRTESMLSAREILRADDDAASDDELAELVQRAMATGSVGESSEGRHDTAHRDTRGGNAEPITITRRRSASGPAMRWIAAAAASIVVILGVTTAVLNDFPGGGNADYSTNDSGASQTATADSSEGARESSNEESSIAGPTDDGSSPSPVPPDRSIFAGAHASATITLN